MFLLLQIVNMFRHQPLYLLRTIFIYIICFSHKISLLHTVAIFAIVDFIFCTFVGLYFWYIPYFTGHFCWFIVTVTTSKATYRFCTAATLLFHICNRSFTFFSSEDILLPYHHFRALLKGASIAASLCLYTCHITDFRKLRTMGWVASSGIKFRLNSMQLGQLVQELK